MYIENTDMNSLKRMKIFIYNQKYVSILALSALVMTILLSACHVGRYFIYNLADVNDYRKFPSLPVTN